MLGAFQEVCVLRVCRKVFLTLNFVLMFLGHWEESFKG